MANFEVWDRKNLENLARDLTAEVQAMRQDIQVLRKAWRKLVVEIDKGNNRDNTTSDN